jgi:DNA-binding NtrC family response regulator
LNILLTFTGFHDPYARGLIGGEEVPGPILSLLSVRNFDQVILFDTPNTRENTRLTQRALAERYPDLSVAVRDVPLNDPTDYLEILSWLRRHFQEIAEAHKGAGYFVAVASGTPQMHASWLLLAAAGELPATLLNIRPPKFVTVDRPLLEEVDLTRPGFPVVRSSLAAPEIPDLPGPDLETALRQSGIVGDHPGIHKALETCALLAPSAAPVLILGETGTGKELFARFIHRLSGRPADRFILVNCGAIPAELVESLLFGHVKGAFTGALRDQAGKFTQAHGGTLFLDELGELPPAAQVKLLRVVQDGLVEPLGAGSSRKVDVRLIGATNKNLRQAIREGQFREDLYYRLNVGEIKLPPLRDRRTDIPKLALHILDRLNVRLKRPKRLTPGALTRLQGQAWPGNVRDLENALERSALLTTRDLLEADDLQIAEPLSASDPLGHLPEPQPGFSLEDYLRDTRQRLLLRALELSQGNQAAAARLLGISPQAVHKFVQEQGPDINLS